MDPRGEADERGQPGLGVVDMSAWVSPSSVPGISRKRWSIAGRTAQEVLADYPYLEHEDILAALEYAAAVVNEREVAAAKPA